MPTLDEVPVGARMIAALEPAHWPAVGGGCAFAPRLGERPNRDTRLDTPCIETHKSGPWPFTPEGWNDKVRHVPTHGPRARVSQDAPRVPWNAHWVKLKSNV